MNARTEPKPVIIWITLMALTIASVAIAELVPIPRLIMIVVFGVAVIKAQLVALHFMEVRQATPHWQTLYRIWIVAVGAMLIIGHLML